MLKILVVAVLVIISSVSHADILAVGLKTHHFSKPSYYDTCRTESHDLVAYEYKGVLAGTYTNSHCMRSYLAGGSYSAYGLGFDVVVVTGYPSKLHIVGGLVIIPQVTYSKFWHKYGLKISYVPSVLVGVGLVYQL